MPFWLSSMNMVPRAILVSIRSNLHRVWLTRFTEGELIIKSRFITKGYLQYDNSCFTVEEDGRVSFRTGDIYGYVADQRLVWLGRKEDYIQVSQFSSSLTVNVS